MGISESGHVHGDKFWIVGAVLRGAFLLDGIVWSQFDQNQEDIVDQIAEMVQKSKFFKELRVIILCSELVRESLFEDLLRLHEILGLPIIALLDNRIPMRFNHLLRSKILLVTVRRGRFLVLCIGLMQDEVEAILGISWKADQLPEPLRIARLVASALETAKS